MGKPVVEGTRLSVELIIELFANGWTNEELVENYPGITMEDIQACLAYAHDALRAERENNESIFDVINSLPPGRRSKEDIDAQMAEERAKLHEALNRWLVQVQRGEFGRPLDEVLKSL